MEIPDYLLNDRKRERLRILLEKIPAVVTQIAEYEGVRVKECLLTVYGYTANGLPLSLDHFWLNKKELLEHLERAESQGCEIMKQGQTITVRRNLPDGKYYIAEYKPTANIK